MLKEPFIKSKSTIEESIEDFILRRLGQEFLDYIVNPFINGIYAGDPSKLCASKAFPKLIVSSGQIDIREDVNQRICNIINNLKSIDSDIDQVMDGWRLKRLPRIDRDILRLAYVDINFLNTPVAVACDEAVNLANKYSDLQGRKFINGVLRRLQTI